MNKIEEYLANLAKKEKIYLFLSIPIILFIIYYNFIYPKEQKIQKHTQIKIKTEMAKISNVVKSIRLIRKKERLVRPTKKLLESKQEEYKFLKYSFENVKIIKLSQNKIYEIITLLLNKSKKLSLNNITFDILWNKTKITPFNENVAIKISGNGKYSDIVRYMQFIEHLKVLLNITQSSIISSTKEQTFQISFVIVGVK